MRVGLLTSWRTQCGIAQYSAHLARALKRQGAEVVILGSQNDTTNGRALPPYPEHEGLKHVDVFDVQVWRADRRHEFHVKRILDMELDVLHVQYEVVLYHREKLQELLDQFSGVKAITWHDSCVPPDMPGPWDLQFRHRADTGPGGEVIPVGIEDTQPVVKTFGLGRSRADIICSICDRHGWKFEQRSGDQSWLSESELHAWLRDSDLIVLWYPDVDSAGSSLAARTALATRRPLIVNDVTWFAELRGSFCSECHTGDDGLRKVPDDPSALEQAMLNTLDRDWPTWDYVAATLLSAYTAALCEKPGGWARAAADV